MNWKFVKIEWEDAASESAWITEKHLPDLAKFITIGWLVQETDRRMTIAASYGVTKDGEMQVGECISIPRACVLSVQELVWP